jgi:hypothetical protein
MQWSSAGKIHRKALQDLFEQVLAMALKPGAM